MVPFYRDVLGLPFVLPYEPDQGWAGFQAGDVTIFLIGRPSRRSRRIPGAGPPGIESFAFEVDDLEEAIAELERRGVTWAADIVESPWYRYRSFYDPEGNLLHITGPIASRSASTRHERSRADGAAVIDCHVHANVPSIEALVPWLDPHWHEVARTTQFRGPTDTAYPPSAATSLRPDLAEPPASPRPSRMCARACSIRWESRRRSWTAPTAPRRSRTPTPPRRSHAP